MKGSPLFRIAKHGKGSSGGASFRCGRGTYSVLSMLFWLENGFWGCAGSSGLSDGS